MWIFKNNIHNSVAKEATSFLVRKGNSVVVKEEQEEKVEGVRTKSKKTTGKGDDKFFSKYK